MSLRNITRTEILAAIAEYDELSRDAFLGKYGFGRARSYLLLHNGKAYDSKAIVGAAHGFLPRERALTARDFSGGEATIGRLLRGLGFTVQAGELDGDRLVRLLAGLNIYRFGGLPGNRSGCRRVMAQAGSAWVARQLSSKVGVPASTADR